MGLEAGNALDKISKLYRQSVTAGRDPFLTNSFGSNAAHLKRHNAAHRAFELSIMSAEIGRNVADKSLHPMVVAGSVGPTVDILTPVENLRILMSLRYFINKLRDKKPAA
jgi:5-methyltetrahydrofolate--homocysteine methyltransferase